MADKVGKLQDKIEQQHTDMNISIEVVDSKHRYAVLQSAEQWEQAKLYEEHKGNKLIHLSEETNRNV